MRLPLNEWKNLYGIPDKVIDELYENDALQPDQDQIKQTFQNLNIKSDRWFDTQNRFRDHNIISKDIHRYDADIFISRIISDYESWVDLFADTKYKKEWLLISRQKNRIDEIKRARFEVVDDESHFYVIAEHKGKVIHLSWGKFLKQLPWLYPKTDSEIEEMVNIAKSKTIMKYDISEVEGQEIIQWYRGSRYASYNTGSLSSSCMRYNACQEYLNIYDQNGIRMIIVTDQEKKLVGRAIIWDKSIWNKKYFDDCSAIVDRIYGTDSTIEMVKNYCKKQGYVFKYRQSYDDPLGFCYMENGELKSVEKRVRMNINTDFDYYPFMDTMYRLEDGCLKNHGNGDKLRETDGNSQSDIMNCESCGNDIDEDCANYVNGDSYCTECSVYSEYSDECYLRDDACWSERDQDYYWYDDATYCEYEQDYIRGDESSQDFQGNWIHHDNVVNDDVDESLIFHEDEFKSFEIIVSSDGTDETNICIPYKNNVTQTMFVNALHEYLKNVSDIVQIKIEDEITDYDTSRNSLLHILLDNYIENHITV